MIQFENNFQTMGIYLSKEGLLSYGSISELFKLKDEYVTTEEVTLWQYDVDQKPKSIILKKHADVKILDCSTKWWNVKYKKIKGYASKYYFSKKFVDPYEKQVWYFGEIPREECEKLLQAKCNADSSFMVRSKEKLDEKIFILSVKHFDEHSQVSVIKHLKITVHGNKLFTVSGNSEEMFSSLQDLVNNLRETMDPNIGIRLKKVHSR